MLDWQNFDELLLMISIIELKQAWYSIGVYDSYVDKFP